jgi:2-alkyl-3-oxoalkanoate reductase
MDENFIISHDETILVTGATGFIGGEVTKNLLERGYRNLRCLTRGSRVSEKLNSLIREYGSIAKIDVIKGNLLSPEDCIKVTKNVAVIYHLAAARGVKSVPDAFLNSVVTTRNLLEATRSHKILKRFVSISSFAVYSNTNKPNPSLLDESCPVEQYPARRGDAYSFAKVKQDQIVEEYGSRFQVPYVIVRPGVVYGPGNEGITGRVGVGTFGIFLHLGGSNPIPFTYVENCAEAIVLAGLRAGVNGEVFNVVDDEVTLSKHFLRLYKKNVRRFTSLYLPHWASYLLCSVWERYSNWSQGQLPPAFNRAAWHAYWKKTSYTNEKIKTRLGWKAKVSCAEGFNRYFASCRQKISHA